MNKILPLILETKKKKIAVLRKNREALISLVKKAPSTLSFKEAIKREGRLSMIAELKQASPSAGVIRQDFDPVKLAKTFKQCGVNAISILTEEEFFLGKLNYIEEVKRAVRIPILRKDFILDEVQIYESRAIGADAILLILRILEEERFKSLYACARELGLDVLVEVHTEKELRKALKCGVDIVGINNRNLHTLTVDLDQTKKLIPFVPRDVVRVSESGIHSLKDILLLKGMEVDAVLIGEAIMKSPDVALKIGELHVDA